MSGVNFLYKIQIILILVGFTNQEKLCYVTDVSEQLVPMVANQVKGQKRYKKI